MEKIIIKDWAGNILNFKGRFESPSFAVPMEFKTSDDAFDWILENIEEDAREDIFVDVIEKEGN
jgi:hypothetical protein